MVGTALFVLGGFCIVITAHKTISAYKNANDSWAGKVLVNLALGSAISAALLFGGIYGVIKFFGSVNQGFGLASGPQPSISLHEQLPNTTGKMAALPAEAPAVVHLDLPA
ncbi:hypothetical protein [Mycobacterium talmoniae]|nr:hypothetical protein [Mycobacterium talmoniae]